VERFGAGLAACGLGGIAACFVGVAAARCLRADSFCSALNATRETIVTHAISPKTRIAIPFMSRKIAEISRFIVAP
jgi:hypothetical protein